MAAATMKHIASNFAKLDKFERVDFKRWHKRMYFLLFNMSVVYVLTTPIPEDDENATIEHIRKRNKWENDDYACTGLILNGMFTQHKMNMDEAIQVSCIIDKLPPSWKYFKHTLKHKKEELTFVELRIYLSIKESLRAHNSDKPKGNNVAGPSIVNMVEHNNSLRAIVKLIDPKPKTLGERGIECIFVGYVEHSKDFRFYVIEPNESVSINSIIESKDVIFNKNRFFLVPRPSFTEEVVVTQQPEPKTRKGKRNRTPKNFEPEFQLYLIEGTRDDVYDQHSYCINVEDDPKTFDEAMKYQDVAFWKEAN
ncbi:hypothetical protein Tco_0721306 [Tanacetum coccineum]